MNSTHTHTHTHKHIYTFIDWTTAHRIMSVIDSMSKKTTFSEQDDIAKNGDGSVAEDAATITEETKAVPRRKSTRKSNATQPTTPTRQVPTLDAMADTEGAQAHTRRRAT